MEEKTSEKDKQVEGDDGWLQLSIGDPTNSRARPIGSPGKLDLFSDGSLHPLRSKSHPSMHGLTLRVWNNSCSMTTSSRSPMAVAMQYEHKGLPGNMMNKVISPPLRPPAGVWFILQAAKNQHLHDGWVVSFLLECSGRGPSLPQISKSYLRIKDNSVTVRFLLKYLATKLGLAGHESESESLKSETEMARVWKRQASPARRGSNNTTGNIGAPERRSDKGSPRRPDVTYAAAVSGDDGRSFIVSALTTPFQPPAEESTERGWEEVRPKRCSACGQAPETERPVRFDQPRCSPHPARQQLQSKPRATEPPARLHRNTTHVGGDRKRAGDREKQQITMEEVNAAQENKDRPPRKRAFHDEDRTSSEKVTPKYNMQHISLPLDSEMIKGKEALRSFTIATVVEVRKGAAGAQAISEAMKEAMAPIRWSWTSKAFRDGRFMMACPSAEKARELERGGILHLPRLSLSFAPWTTDLWEPEKADGERRWVSIDRMPMFCWNRDTRA
ncbi:hypothetical protein J5N97_019156 [Dioscorea zingiberensis]|uniref:DUF4283 domain-containing protein n=1 Tax=Dioscorea zingiberensis TaxID=325984 RepID=A0A9D5CDF5_9LILI|nr:hypothetical protein J5N97_019156 [Dioscorea zingiberensis]